MIHHVVRFGSHVYGTANENSDTDCYVISDLVEGYEDVRHDDKDMHIVSDVHFQKMLDEHHIVAMEVYFHSIGVQDDFKFEVDLQQLRKSISAVVSNSWVKSKKKMLVENEDYIGRKSMWHSLRILMFGIQIAKHGKIVDFSEANEYYDDIVKSDKSYEELKETYHPIMLSKQTEFRILAPKEI